LRHDLLIGIIEYYCYMPSFKWFWYLNRILHFR